MTNFSIFNQSWTALLRNLGIFFLINVFLTQAFGDEPTNRPDGDPDKIVATKNLVDARDSQLDRYYIGIKSDQSSTIRVVDKAKKVEERDAQGGLSTVTVSANLSIVCSVLETIDKKVERKLKDLQNWFA